MLQHLVAGLGDPDPVRYTLEYLGAALGVQFRYSARGRSDRQIQLVGRAGNAPFIRNRQYQLHGCGVDLHMTARGR
ncbi:hypothetical protein D3C77_785750 [compost metagenome]